MFLTFIVTIILLAFSFGISFLIQLSKKSISNSRADGSTKEFLISKGLTVLLSLVITAVNAILSIVIRWMSKKEKHETHTELK